MCRPGAVSDEDDVLGPIIEEVADGALDVLPLCEAEPVLAAGVGWRPGVVSIVNHHRVPALLMQRRQEPQSFASVRCPSMDMKGPSPGTRAGDCPRADWAEG